MTMKSPASAMSVESIMCPDDDIEEAKTETTGEAEPGYKTKRGVKHFLRSIKDEATSIFNEEFELVEKQILDPRGAIVTHWNKLLLVACLISLFVDPMFFYAPKVRDGMCIEEDMFLKLVLTVIRSLVDGFYIVQLYVRFKTAYVAPPSRVFGAGELVTDLEKIASRYIGRGFYFDLIAALPLPQVLVWMSFPNLGRLQFMEIKLSIRLIIIFQFLLRLYITFKLSSEIVEATGIITENAWLGAAFNLLLYMLASHVIGSCWYLLSIERQEACWLVVCTQQTHRCQYGFPYCTSSRAAWFNGTNLPGICVPERGSYDFGIYAEALVYGITNTSFLEKFLYSLWWGVKQLSSLGQGLQVSTHVSEIIFAIVIGILGLVLFGLLIGNMQMYLQSTTMRIEEWRIKRADAEMWMRNRQLTPELKRSVRRYFRYLWVATGGFEEEQILNGLPKDLRREIKRHLYSDLVRQVPLFDQMDDQMLDAICERLKNVLYIRGSNLLSEGAPVTDMIFIIRGHLDSYNTNGGHLGFFNICRVGPGDFCGEELLTWAMVPHPNAVLPSSTRTVKCASDVEALALSSDDLKCVALQFRRAHWKHLRPLFRFSSHQWRTWAACFIQASWRSYIRRRRRSSLSEWEENVCLKISDEKTIHYPSRKCTPHGEVWDRFGSEESMFRKHMDDRAVSRDSLSKKRSPRYRIEAAGYASNGDPKTGLSSPRSCSDLRKCVGKERSVRRMALARRVRSYGGLQELGTLQKPTDPEFLVDVHE